LRNNFRKTVLIDRRLKRYTENEIIAGFSGDDRLLGEIYGTYYQGVKNHIISNSGSVNDAESVYQEAMIIIYSLIQKQEFTLNCSFKTFLYSICHNLWLKKLNSNYNTKIELKDEFDKDTLVIPVTDKQFVDRLKYRIFRKYYQILGDECRKLLSLFIRKVPYKTIYQKMGYKNEAYARKRKHYCKSKLIELIRSDTDYQILLKNEQ